MAKTLSTRTGKQRPVPASSHAVDMIIARLNKWSEDPESRQIKQFYIRYNITRKEFMILCSVSPELERARVMAMYRLADRQQEALWDGMIPSQRVHYIDKFIHMVDEEYHEVNIALKQASKLIMDTNITLGVSSMINALKEISSGSQSNEVHAKGLPDSSHTSDVNR